MKLIKERIALKTNRYLLLNLLAAGTLLGLSSSARAQQPDAPTPQPDAVVTSPAAVAVPQTAQSAVQPVNPIVLTLQDALNRARSTSTVYQSAVTDAKSARQDHYQA